MRIVLDAPSTMTALGTAIVVVGLIVSLEKGLIAAVRFGKALGAELGFFKKLSKYVARRIFVWFQPFSFSGKPRQTAAPGILKGYVGGY
jgi:hypothetical protein